tara:strand:+ start:406 stop:2247 length:1842 start_codon:yes stop_codon:yes gene_type:complete
VNKFKIWQIFIIYAIVLVGIIYALPNFYPTKPSLQIAFGDSSKLLGKNITTEVSKVLKDQEIKFNEIEIDGSSFKVIFEDLENQLAGRRALANYSEGEFIIAMASEPTTPDWLRSIGGKPLNLGLDLAGGIHFLLEVDTTQYQEENLSSEAASIEGELRTRNIASEFTSEGKNITFTFTNLEDLNAAREYINQINVNANGTNKYTIIQVGNNLTLEYTESYLSEIVSAAVVQNETALRNRVNELGVSEPIVQRQGRERIIVELPGVQDSASARKIIGKTANLEFRLQAKPNDSFLRVEVFPFRENPASKVRLEKVVIFTGESVTNAQSGFDESGNPQVNISLNIEGGRAMQNATRDNIGRNLGVVLIEQKTKTFFDDDNNVNQITEPYRSVISNATIQDVLGTNFRITGLQNSTEANELALLLRAGALAAPMEFVEEQTIGPTLGQENITKGVNSVLIGFLLVFIFMIIRYRFFGLAANIALIINLFLVTAVMSVIGATLTLPGIAGIVLTVGMAVDANVLIFARISEELKNNIEPQIAIKNGFAKAFSTIIDANVTTLLVALILYAIGTGPIKGFAVTLSIGIITSIFTAIMVTRSLVNFFYGYRDIKELKL